MTLSPGSRIGPYEVIGALGAGGMGEVYRARDAKLNRDVAIKVLPALFSGDPERVIRFTREAQALAALNHPNIAHIHGLEEGGAFPALIMELVDGDDLSARVARGPLPLGEALSIARQIADGLEAAHESGIVHRDLKPANIKVRADGAVKILDFGLAKAMDPAGTTPLASGATLTAGGTMTGTIVGTAAYMAPEQACGKAVDKRTDIWAFGAVLYEMLTGRRAFAGEGVSDTLAKVIEREPDWTALSARVPPSVRTLIELCLRKDPARRLRDIGDARLYLEATVPGPPAAPAVTATRSWALAGVVVAALAAGYAAGGWVRAGSGPRPQPASRPVQLDLLLPNDHELFTVAGSQLTIAPDGSKLAYVAVGGGTRDLYVRELDGHSSTKLRGTESAVAGFFSPDSRSLGLLARDRTLKRLSLADGLVSDIGELLGTNAPVWGSDGFLVFARQGLWRLSASGGSPARVTTLDPARREVAHTPGAVLASGTVLFTSWTADGDRPRVESLTPRDGVRRVLVEDASSPLFAATGHLVFHRDGAVLAVPFDDRQLRVTGDAVIVIPPETIRLSAGHPLMSISATGTLVYAPVQTGLAYLVRVTRDGAVHRLTDVPRPHTHPRVSPDGTRVIVEHASDSLWLHDLSREARTPLTPGRLPGVSFPVWARDGRRIVFRLFDELWSVDAGGSGRTERIEGGLPGDIPTALAPDNDTLVILRTNVGTGGDIFALSLSGASPPRALVQTAGYDGGADFSQDGKWLVYASTDSGVSQIYLSPFPAMDRKWAISTRGGTQARWSRTGREVFYRDGNRMMAVRTDLAGDVRLGSPTLLFDQAFTTGAYVTVANYDVTPDGSFVMLQAEPGVPRLTVVLNWFDELKRRLAPGF